VTINNNNLIFVQIHKESALIHNEKKILTSETESFEKIFFKKNKKKNVQKPQIGLTKRSSKRITNIHFDWTWSILLV